MPTEPKLIEWLVILVCLASAAAIIYACIKFDAPEGDEDSKK